jgi:hypothetical protein
MRTWIPQHCKKKNCGIIAVAVVAGVSVEEAAKAIGKNGTTTTKQIAKGLRAFGYECGDRCKPFKKSPFPKLAIAQMKSPDRRSGWHWVVIDNGLIYDGLFGNKDGSVRWPIGGKITSLLEIKEKI